MILDFIWSSVVLGEETFLFANMLIPVRVNNELKAFMTLDLGTEKTLIFKNKIQEIYKNSKAGKNKISIYIDENTCVNTDYQFINYNIGIEDIMGNNVIGVLGIDSLLDNYIKIDFKNKAIHLNRTVYDKVSYTKIDIFNKKAIIKININNKIFNMLYDSGASLFSLLFTKAVFKKYFINNLITSTFSVPSWDSNVLIYKYINSTNLIINNQEYPVEHIYYTDFNQLGERSNESVFLDNNIHGILGNSFLRNYTLTIDYKNECYRID